jgi:ABC-2 type transport system permease protein
MSLTPTNTSLHSAFAGDPETTTAVIENTHVAEGERARTEHARIPFRTVLGVELRKAFDTRSGFWLMVAIAAAGVIATGAVVAFASDSDLTYDNFAAAIGVPMTILLPVVAILAVTGEWSQRAGLTTFTLVPHRGRVIRAKMVVTIAIGLASMALALGVGALGNIVATGLKGVDTTWDLSFTSILYIVGADLIGMMVGFMLGVVTRNSAGAIVSYFSYWFVVPTLSMLLAANQSWFEKAQPWVDFSYDQGRLYDGGFSGQDWSQLAVTGAFWLLLPLAFGLWRVMRAEVK